MYKAHTKYVEPNCLATQTGNIMGDFFYIYYEGFNDVLKCFNLEVVNTQQYAGNKFSHRKNKFSIGYLELPTGMKKDPIGI